MVSHDSITYLVRYVGADVTKLKPFAERFVSYLPLSHIAAQLVDIFATMCVGATVYFVTFTVALRPLLKKHSTFSSVSAYHYVRSTV